jgi:hypothetical protein
MKRVTALALCLTLTGVLAAQTQPGTSSTTGKTAKRKATSSNTEVLNQINELKQAVDAQQQQIKQLSDQVQSRDQQIQQLQQKLDQDQSAAQTTQSLIQQVDTKASNASTQAGQASDSLSKMQSDVADIRNNTTNMALSQQDEQKKLSTLASAFGRFRFTGDVRVRGESFFQQGIQDRNRGRIRVRLGLEGALNQDFIGGLAIATGSMGDPTTTNETLTNIFDRKTIALDKGYITYNPVKHPWFSATGGKFAYLWQRTPVTGDTDLNPEGFDQKLSFDIKHSFIQNVTLQGIELLYGEVSSGQDSYVIGGSGQVKVGYGPWTATASVLSQNWNRPDSILNASAFAVQATSTGGVVTIGGVPTTITGFPTPGEGPGCASAFGSAKFPNCIFAPNGMTNATYLDTAGKIHFYSGFNIVDTILNNTFKTPVARLPINLLLEFEDNLNAATHPLDMAGNPITNVGSQNKEYGGDISIGQQKNKNDLQFGYSWYRQEQDAVLASITESDQRSPTNVIQNKIYANWKIQSNTAAQFTWWRGRTLNTALENNAAFGKTVTVLGAEEPWLNRLQFDLVYTY